MAPTQQKPIGGIRAVTIVPLEGTSRPVPLVGERSSYAEEVLSDNGILRVHHTLTLVMPRTEAAALLDRVPSMISEGVLAYVTTSAGERLTVGWSDRFKMEQPLRLTSFLLASGTRPADGNEAILRLESDDTTPLQELI